MILLLAKRRAGNNSLSLIKEIVQLIDIAAAKEIITDEEARKLTEKNNSNLIKSSNTYTIHTKSINKK